MTAEAIAQALRCGQPGCPCGKRQGKEWRTHCPCHDDVHPSLDIADSDGARLLLKCRAGCSQEALIEALKKARLWPEPSQPLQGLTLADLAAAKGLPPDLLRHLGLSDFKGKIRIPYLDANGQEVAVRFRHSLSGVPRFTWRRGDRPILYGLWQLSEARRLGFLVLAEGESDCWTLWHTDIPALGIPGASTWQSEWASLLDGLQVFLWREPDAGGDSLAHKVASDLANARIMEAPQDAKDPSALWLHVGRDPSKFRQHLEKLMQAAQPASELAAEATTRAVQEALRRAGGLLDRPDILDVVGQALRDLGYAGGLCQPLLLYLAITSRLLLQPVNVVLYGPSAGGKTFMVETVSPLFPAQAMYDATASSERAWVYTDENFRHRFLIIGEAAALHRDGVGASIIRSVAWGGRIAYDTVEKTAGGLRGRRIEKDGPTGVVTTATKPLEGELATRFLAIDVPDDPSQTRAVLEATAARANGVASVPDLEPLVAMQEWLQLAGSGHVVVPFARRLAELFPAEMVRARRDFTHLLTLIQTHALLHQRQRGRDGAGRIVADLADYREVYRLAQGVFAALAAGGLTDAVRETATAVADLYDGQEPIGTAALARVLRLERTQVWRRAVTACALGYLINVETRPGRPLKLVPGDPLPEDRPALPDPDDLIQSDIPAERERNHATDATSPIGAELAGAVAWGVAPDGATADATSCLDTNSHLERLDGCIVAPETRETAQTCTHRPLGEVDDRWARVGGDDLHACLCCGGPVQPDLWADGLCPVCREAPPVKVDGGHLVRLALDLGAQGVSR